MTKINQFCPSRSTQRKFTVTAVTKAIDLWRICSTSEAPVLEKVCSSKGDAAFTSSPPTEFVMYDRSKTCVISHRHLTEGTRASEAGPILQKSMHKVCFFVHLSPESPDPPLWYKGLRQWHWGQPEVLQSQSPHLLVLMTPVHRTHCKRRTVSSDDNERADRKAYNTSTRGWGVS